jgi:diaminopimelate decarboxylase
MIARVSVAATELLQVYPQGTRVTERGHLEIGGCDTVELVREFGSPAYVVAEDDLRARARSFLEALVARHRDHEVLFGSKAFPCTAVYRALAEEGLGCDVASGGELHLALRGGFDPSRIYLHGNAKSEAELRTAVLARVGHVVLDSFDDVERLDRVAGELGARQAVMIRVTPGVTGDTHHAISTGQADSKFGFSATDARQALERVRGSAHLDLAGLHCHIGSQLFALEPFADAVRAVAEVDDSLPTYNFGGGLGVAYTAGERAPSTGEYVETIVEAAHRSLGADKRLVLEPGRALVAQSAVTLYTVETVKRNVSTWVAVDGGMSDNLRPMLYGARYEALIADRPLTPGTERCHLAGKHCESGDVIIRDLMLPDPAPGDVVATPVTGAYGYALANNYNSVMRPPVIFCRAGVARLVVRRETHDDLTARDLD